MSIYRLSIISVRYIVHPQVLEMLAHEKIVLFLICLLVEWKIRELLLSCNDPTTAGCTLSKNLKVTVAHLLVSIIFVSSQMQKFCNSPRACLSQRWSQTVASCSCSCPSGESSLSHFLPPIFQFLQMHSTFSREPNAELPPLFPNYRPRFCRWPPCT